MHILRMLLKGWGGVLIALASGSARGTDPALVIAELVQVDNPALAASSIARLVGTKTKDVDQFLTEAGPEMLDILPEHLITMLLKAGRAPKFSLHRLSLPARFDEASRSKWNRALVEAELYHLYTDTPKHRFFREQHLYRLIARTARTFQFIVNHNVEVSQEIAYGVFQCFHLATGLQRVTPEIEVYTRYFLKLTDTFLTLLSENQPKDGFEDPQVEYVKSALDRCGIEGLAQLAALRKEWNAARNGTRAIAVIDRQAAKLTELLRGFEIGEDDVWDTREGRARMFPSLILLNEPNQSELRTRALGIEKEAAAGRFTGWRRPAVRGMVAGLGTGLAAIALNWASGGELDWSYGGLGLLLGMVVHQNQQAKRKIESNRSRELSFFMLRHLLEDAEDQRVFIDPSFGGVLVRVLDSALVDDQDDEPQTREEFYLAVDNYLGWLSRRPEFDPQVKRSFLNLTKALPGRVRRASVEGEDPALREVQKRVLDRAKELSEDVAELLSIPLEEARPATVRGRDYRFEVRRLNVNRVSKAMVHIDREREQATFYVSSLIYDEALKRQGVERVNYVVGAIGYEGLWFEFDSDRDLYHVMDKWNLTSLDLKARGSVSVWRSPWSKHRGFVGYFDKKVSDTLSVGDVARLFHQIEPSELFSRKELDEKIADPTYPVPPSAEDLRAILLQGDPSSALTLAPESQTTLRRTCKALLGSLGRGGLYLLRPHPFATYRARK